MKRLLIILTVVIVLALAGVGIWRLIPLRDRFYTDADTIRTPIADARIREILWEPPRPLPDVINLPGTDAYEPRLSGDGLTIYFVLGKAGDNAEIYVAHRTREGWSDPQALAAVNSDYEDLGPEPTPDGRALFFYSDRPGGAGGYDLWVAYRRDDGRSDAGWLDPVNLGPSVNSGFNDYGLAVTPDGTTLYFASNRPQPGDTRQPNPAAWPATVREDLFHRTYDLYTASITDAGPTQAVPVDALNTPYNEGAPAVSAFGDFLYFASDRPGGQGAFDLYRARRLHGSHRVAENLGPAVNTSANELDPGLSLGGYRLFFSSDRASWHASATEPVHYALYHTTSREVFRDVVTRERAAINWAALWSAIGPGLLWLLLALAALLALLWFMRGLQEREVSLLTKCLLASLLIHLLLLLLFSLWQVTASIAGEFRRGGRIQVALAPHTTGEDIAGQVLGAMTDISQPDAVDTAPSRRDTRIELHTEAQLASLAVERQVLDAIETPRITVSASDATPTGLLDFDRRMTERSTPEPDTANMPELTTPREARRVDTSETSAEAPQAANPPASRRMADVIVDASPAPTPSAIVDPTIVPDDRAESTTDKSLVAIAPTRDATPEARSSSPTGLLPPQPLDAPSPTTDIRLVREGRTHAAPSQEVAAIVEPVVVRATRAPVQASAIDPRIAKPMALIEPDSETRADSEDGSFVERRPIEDVVTTSVTLERAQPDPSREMRWPVIPPSTLTLPDERQAAREPTATPTEAQFDPATALASRSTPTTPRAEPAATQPVMSLSELALVPPEPTPLDGTDAPISSAPLQLADARVDEMPTRAFAPAQAPNVAPDRAVDELRMPAEFARVGSSEQPTTPHLIPPRAATGSPARFDRVEPNAAAATSHELPLPDRFLDADPAPRFENALASATDAAVPRSVLSSMRAPHDPVSTPPALSLDLNLPRDEVPPENPYAQRTAPNRFELVERKGGSRETEQAVDRALAWLARHQSEDGRWDADVFDADCGQCGGETKIAADVAITGLSTLCFLGAGHTHTKDGPYRNNVARALRWLVAQQRSDGDLRVDETMYTHGIATIALSEARSMTGDSSLTDPVERAIRFIYRSRNRNDGGWRYDPGQPGDTSVLGWQVMALKSAAMSGLSVPGEAFEVARRWLDRVDGGPSSGLYAYMPGRPFTPSMTAEGMFVRQLLGEGPNEERMRASAAFVIQHLPDWNSDPNTYFWYYASLALYQHGGDAWDTWNAALTRELLAHQRKDDGAAGSWDPLGEWAELGGRVYQTALCTLMLEVYYRYLPLYSAGASEPVELPVDAIGAIRGSITDKDTGATLEDAVVRLIVPDREPVIARTDRNGDYAMFVPEMPDFFALSASRDGYIPASTNVDTRAVERGRLGVNFELERQDGNVLVMEAVPEVHHLGDDKFDGRINSKFQKSSEGAAFETTFELSEAQLADLPGEAEVRMLVKGVQRRHRIVINGQTLDDRLDDAPDDGSFGAFRVGFDASLLHAGSNIFAVIAAPSSSDIDDFEFVNVRIHLRP